MTENKAPTDREWFTEYDRRQAEQAQALLASLPARRARVRRAAR